MELNFCVAASGGGSTGMAVYESTKSGVLKNKAHMGLVIVSDPEAGIIQKLNAVNFPSRDIVYVPWRQRSERVADWILDACYQRGINFFAQFGLTPLTPKAVFEHFANGHRAINQHPERNVEFGGRGMHGIIPHRALVLFSRKVNRYIPGVVISQRLGVELDSGAVLNYEFVEWDFYRDSAEAVQKKKLPREHQVQIQTLLDFCNDRVSEKFLEPIMQPGEEEELRKAREYAILEEEFPKWMRR